MKHKVVRFMEHASKNRHRVQHNALSLVFYVISMEILVFSYFDRRVLTCWMIFAGLGWPLSMPKKFVAEHIALISCWTMLCLSTSVFTLLSVELAEDINLM